MVIFNGFQSLWFFWSYFLNMLGLCYMLGLYVVILKHIKDVMHLHVL